MRTMAALAVLVGGLELLNTFGAATAVGRGGRSAIGVASIVLVIAVSALLLASGIALLIRRRRAIGFARVAAFACVGVFAAIAAIRPGFSIAATLLGIAFPIAMLLFPLRRATPDSASADR